MTKDRNKAMEWFEKAAVGGNTRAKIELGQCYAFEGQWDEVSVVEGGSRRGTCGGSSMAYYKRCNESDLALEWYKKAAEQGHMWSLFHLGEHYHYVVKDEKKPSKCIIGQWNGVIYWLKLRLPNLIILHLV